jgi:hypothetical protein
MSKSGAVGNGDELRASEHEKLNCSDIFINFFNGFLIVFKFHKQMALKSVEILNYQKSVKINKSVCILFPLVESRSCTIWRR